MYAHVENGNWTKLGSGLPKEWRGRKDLADLDEVALKALGWIPLIETKVEFGVYETKVEEEIIIDTDENGPTQVRLINKKRAMTAEEIVKKDITVAKQSILAIEETITPRRLRDHILGTGGTWLQDKEDLIAVERIKLRA